MFSPRISYKRVFDTTILTISKETIRLFHKNYLFLFLNTIVSKIVKLTSTSLRYMIREIDESPLMKSDFLDTEYGRRYQGLVLRKCGAKAMTHLPGRFVLLYLTLALSTGWPTASGATTLDLQELFTPAPPTDTLKGPFDPGPGSVLGETLQAGRQALLSDDLKTAERLAREAITRDPLSAEGWHLLGLTLANLGDASGAIEALGEAGDLYSFNAEPYIIQGDILLTLGDIQQARAAYARAIGQDPGNWRAHQGLANAHAAAGNAEGARAALVDAISTLEPAADGRLDPRVELAQAIAIAGDVEAALALLSEFASAHPNDAEALLMLGRMQIVADAYDDAAETLARAAAQSDSPMRALLALATAEQRRAELGAARAALTAARDLDPDDPSVHMRLGELAHAAGDAEGSVRHFRDAVAAAGDGGQAGDAKLRLARALLAAGRPEQISDALAGLAPDSDPVRLLRARSALMQDDFSAVRAALDGAPTSGPAIAIADQLLEAREFDRARDVLEAAQETYPDAVAPLARLGRLYGALKLYDLGSAAFTQALALEPGRPDLERGAMMIAYRTGNMTDARRRAERLAAAERPVPQDLVWLARIAEAEGDTTTAVDAYERAVALHPTHWLALNNLAALLMTDAPGRAVTLAAQAAELAPDVAQVRHTLGWAFFHNGDFDEAEAVYRALVETEPHEARTAYRMGRILVERGALEEGRAELQRAAGLDPDFKDADAMRGTRQSP
ncbi:tetratricopeptide repeat protein [Roseovarius sp. D22-M7]|uniref:tetratricopeptide repeat protein n=1 Tax=Roseovarius sp. D22-M7 TaxID=3127116 RepID=UPI00300FEFD8